jgi:hypothetical protein
MSIWWMSFAPVADATNAKENAPHSVSAKIHDHGKRMKPPYDMGFSCVRHAQVYGIGM